MFKTLKKAALAVAFSFTAIGAQAQFNVGGAIALNNYTHDIGLFFAFQPRIGFDYKEGKLGITAGLNYSPASRETEGSRTASNSTRTNTIKIAITETLRIQNYFIHAHYRFGNEDNNFRFGFIAGPSVDMISLKYRQGRPKTGYNFDDGGVVYENAQLTGPKVDVGMSGEYRSGKGILFAEVILGMPANQVNGQYIDNPTVAHYGLWLGYKFVFGQRNNNYF
jgi:hypothetical protein